MSVNERKLYAYDCIEVLNDELALPSGSVDLIYLDPPFNSKSTYNLPFKGRYKKDAKPVQAFTDTWTWGRKQDEYLKELSSGPESKKVAEFVSMVRRHLDVTPTSRGRKSGGGGGVVVYRHTW